jgi:hypothetical protein
VGESAKKFAVCSRSSHAGITPLPVLTTFNNIDQIEFNDLQAAESAFRCNLPPQGIASGVMFLRSVSVPFDLGGLLGTADFGTRRLRRCGGFGPHRR